MRCWPSRMSGGTFIGGGGGAVAQEIFHHPFAAAFTGEAGRGVGGEGEDAGLGGEDAAGAGYLPGRHGGSRGR